MSIYVSSRVLPYVYKLTHKETGQFYIGYREANKVPSSEDLGKKYFTSSKKIKTMGFSSFDYSVVAEFFDGASAYDFENFLIAEFINHPLNLNKHCLKSGQKRFINGSHTKEAKENIRKAAQGRRHWTNGIMNKNSKTCPGPGWYIGECKSEKAFKQRREATLGKKWWTNGIINMRSTVCPGLDWTTGQTMSPERQSFFENKIGAKYWNNGTVNKLTKECPGADWVLGKIQRHPTPKIKQSKWVVSFLDGTPDYPINSLKTWCLENNFDYSLIKRAHRNNASYKNMTFVCLRFKAQTE